MRLDCLARDVLGLGDLGVREALGGELGDAPLGRGQGVDARQDQTARSRPASAQLLARLPGERGRPAAKREVHTGGQRLARRHSPIGASQPRSQRHQRAGVLQARRRRREQLDGFLEPREAFPAALQDPAHDERCADRASHAEPAGELQLVLDEAKRRYSLAERVEGQRRSPTPGQPRRVDEAPLVLATAALEQRIRRGPVVALGEGDHAVGVEQRVGLVRF